MSTLRVWKLKVAIGLRERPGGPPGDYDIPTWEGPYLCPGEEVMVVPLSDYNKLKLALENIKLHQETVGNEHLSMAWNIANKALGEE